MISSKTFNCTQIRPLKSRTLELILSWCRLWEAGWACLLMRRCIHVFHAFEGAWGYSSWPALLHGSNPPGRWHRWIAASTFTLIYCLKVVKSHSCCWRGGWQSSCWERGRASVSVWSLVLAFTGSGLTAMFYLPGHIWGWCPPHAGSTGLPCLWPSLVCTGKLEVMHEGINPVGLNSFSYWNMNARSSSGSAWN